MTPIQNVLLDNNGAPQIVRIASAIGERTSQSLSAYRETDNCKLSRLMKAAMKLGLHTPCGPESWPLHGLRP
jgi:hypothetical protein